MSIVSERHSDYGPPAEHFARTTAILAQVFGPRTLASLRPEEWALVMICDKLGRLGEPIRKGEMHRDSLVDIGGYAECALECLPIPPNPHGSQVVSRHE